MKGGGGETRREGMKNNKTKRRGGLIKFQTDSGRWKKGGRILFRAGFGDLGSGSLVAWPSYVFSLANRYGYGCFTRNTWGDSGIVS